MCECMEEMVSGVFITVIIPAFIFGIIGAIFIFVLYKLLPKSETIQLKKIHWTCTKERGHDEMISAVAVGNGESSECIQWTKN